MTLTLTEEMTSDLNNVDPCLQFSIQNIAGTNLFLLVLGNRKKLGCDDLSYQVGMCKQVNKLKSERTVCMN